MSVLVVKPEIAVTGEKTPGLVKALRSIASATDAALEGNPGTARWMRGLARGALRNAGEPTRERLPAEGEAVVPRLSLRLVEDGEPLRLPLSRVTCSADAAEVARALIGDLPVEHMLAILVDGRGGITNVLTLAQGGAHGLGVRTPDVLRAVLTGFASAFVLAHNHPSGDPAPSAEDVRVTRTLREAAEAVGVPLLDHVIVARGGGFAAVPATP